MKRYIKLSRINEYIDMSTKNFKKYVLPNIPSYRIGKTIYVDTKDIDRFIQANKVETEDYIMKKRIEEVVNKLLNT